ncbi:MAG: DUF1292 domain-containing protein [Clostridia bacterium]|nr:DUF1292 domain-containing protein [Clostridia bacterium]
MKKENKSFLTFVNEDGSETVYELLDQCDIDGSTYVAIAPTEYYVLKKIKSNKNEDTYVPLEDSELERVFPVFDARINILDHDKK